MMALHCCGNARLLLNRSGHRLTAAVLARSASGASGSASLTMPPCDFKPRPYTGKSYEETMKIRKELLNPAMLTYYKKPVLIHQGHMQWLFDHEGNRYLDFGAGIVTVSVGHCHPKVNARLKDQIDTLWHTTCIYPTPPIHEYAEKLVAKLPGNLKVVYFTNSGSEANDMAVHMARVYTGAYDIITHKYAYHGASPQTMALAAIGSWKYQTPTSFGVHHSMNPNVYRGLFGGSHCRDSIAQPLRSCDCPPDHCKASDQYADQLTEVLATSCPKRVAAFFAEPIQGAGGVVQYPKGYLKKAYEIIRSRGGLCVADEVQTGFGRLGSHFWGFETEGLIPDIVTMAKGIGNGYPLAAVVTTPEIAATMATANHFNTYGGSPMACVAGSTVLDVIEEDGLQANAAQMGELFLTEAMALREEFEIVGDVRGKGLMLGIEFVKSKKTQEPLPTADMLQLHESLKDYGVLMLKGGALGNLLRVKPPMCITEQDVHFAVAALRQSLKDYESSM